MTGGHWYNTSICNKLHGNCLRYLLLMQELKDITSCVLLMHMEKSINRLAVMMAAAVGIFQYQQIQLQKHYNRSLQP